jgi:hypothetical protein
MTTALAFTKGAGKSDSLLVTRADGRSERIECPKQRIIPHDMVHYAVETMLAARGFLGRVAAGEDAGFTMMADPESDGIERLVEVVQGDAWSGGMSAPNDMIDLYRVTCAARDCPPLPLDEAAIAAIRAEFDRLTQAWGALPVSGTLTLHLD